MSKVVEVLQALREEAAHLRAELSRVERAIGALEEALGMERSTAPDPGRAVEARAVAPAGPYASLPIGEAAAEYLASAGEPKTSREIADALRAGGFPTRSRDFGASVRTTLHRMLPSDGIERVEGGKWRFTGRRGASD